MVNHALKCFKAFGLGSYARTLTIRGPILKVYRAHALLMRRYHESQVQEQVGESEEEQKVQAGHEKVSPFSGFVMFRVLF